MNILLEIVKNFGEFLLLTVLAFIHTIGGTSNTGNMQ